MTRSGGKTCSFGLRALERGRVREDKRRARSTYPIHAQSERAEGTPQTDLARPMRSRHTAFPSINRKIRLAAASTWRQGEDAGPGRRPNRGGKMPPSPRSLFPTRAPGMTPGRPPIHPRYRGRGNRGRQRPARQRSPSLVTPSLLPLPVSSFGRCSTGLGTVRTASVGSTRARRRVGSLLGVREVDEFVAISERWGYWSDGCGELLPSALPAPSASSASSRRSLLRVLRRMATSEP